MEARRVAVITGGGGVLGRETAMQLVGDGFDVVVAGRTAETLEETVRLVTDKGGNARSLVSDVAREGDVKALFEYSLAEFGACTALVHCAATHGRPMRLRDMPIEEWNRVVETNLTSAFLCTRAALDQMLGNGGGSLVFVSSAGTLRGFPLAACYAATKSALFGFARTLAAEVGAEGVRANVLVPGAMPESAIYQSAMPGIAEEFGYAPEDGERILQEMSAMRRVCTPREIAEAAVFLATDRSSAMTGQVLVADGGLTV
jgi:NAD(P)-dependent dehydrogenase (short-subunit alcohol dehydrogenase family)